MVILVLFEVVSRRYTWRNRAHVLPFSWPSCYFKTRPPSCALGTSFYTVLEGRDLMMYVSDNYTSYSAPSPLRERGGYHLLCVFLAQSSRATCKRQWHHDKLINLVEPVHHTSCSSVWPQSEVPQCPLISLQCIIWYYTMLIFHHYLNSYWGGEAIIRRLVLLLITFRDNGSKVFIFRRLIFFIIFRENGMKAVLNPFPFP